MGRVTTSKIARLSILGIKSSRIFFFFFFFTAANFLFLCDEGEALERADCKYSNENSENFPELTNFYRVYKETRLMRFAKSLLKRKLEALTREISGCGSVKLGDGIFGMDKRDI